MKNKRKYRKKNIEQEKKIWNQKIKRNIDRKIRKKKNRNKNILLGRSICGYLLSGFMNSPVSSRDEIHQLKDNGP
jgi:hypothetical protein